MTTEVAVGLIGFGGTILGAVASAVVTYRLSARRVSDREQLLKWQVAFNRSAFRGPYQMHSAQEPFIGAIDDTLQAIRTGMLVTRSKVEIVNQRGKGLTDLKDRQLRAKMSDVVGRLETIRQSVRSQLDKRSLEPDFVNEVDQDRDAVIQMMNQMWKRFGIDPLPLPTEIADYQRVFGD